MRRFFLATGLIFALDACQSGSPSVSLEEAKQITVTFEGGSFTPPPRTIADITAILDQQKIVDLQAMAAAQQAAGQKPPSGLGNEDLAKFYWDRGMAAGKIGDNLQKNADLTEAARLAKEAGRRDRYKIVWDLSLTEVYGGNLTNGIRHREEAIFGYENLNNGRTSVGMSSSLAVTYAQAGDIDAADRLLAKAYNRYLEIQSSPRRGNWKDLLTGTLHRAKAMFLNFQGKFEEAEALFRSALVAAKENARLFPQREYAHLLVEGIRAELGENLARQGRLIEAEIEVRKALTDVLGRLGRNSIETAQILRRVITIIGEQGRHGEAEMLARALTDIYVSIGSPADAWSLALSRRLLAETLVNQGRWQEALAEFDAIKLGLASDADVFDQAFAENLDWALALAGANRADEALAMAKSAVERVRRTVGDKHYNTAEASGVLAKALAGLDKREEALGEFRKALPILLSRSRQADDENTTKAARAQRLGLILEAYIGLLADVRGTKLESASGIDATAESFRLANVARGRSVQSALAASAVRSAARTPELADLLRREQDARKQIGALFGLLANALSVPTDEQNAGVIKDLRVRVDLLRTARATLAEEIAARFPDYFELINPKPATIEQARLALRPGEALITTYVGADRTYVWAVPKTGDVAFTAVDLGLESLTEAVVELRSALDPDAESLGDIPQFDLATAHRLYRALLEPVRVGWKDSKSLLVIAHGPLGYLPLSLLPTKAVTVADAASLFSGYRDVPWLVRDHAVTVLPSVVSLRTLRALPARPGVRKAFVGFGDPYFSKEQEVAAAKPKAKQTAVLASRGLKTRGLPVRLRAAPKTQGINSAQLAMLPRLPDTADEVQGMAAALKADPATSVFLGKAAGETAVKAMDLSAVKVIAFATHGLVPGDLNGLTQPALALSSPAVAGGGDDGLLTMGEILGLRLNADWVVLSACDTGSGEGAGAEAVSGLGRAFFYAGTRALLVSNWPVETTSARILTTRLFAAQAADPGLERTQALRRTMLALIDGPGPKDDQGKVLFSYAHPIFWAPFSLVGDGGGRKPAS